MKTETPIKVKNKFSPTEVYYSFSTWPSKEIDGVVFVPVVKQPPSHTLKQTIHYMRKDSLEKTK
jgi:hypothetical protein